jgi:uncharacterized protein (TIGR03067 family)
VIEHFEEKGDSFVKAKLLLGSVVLWLVAPHVVQDDSSKKDLEMLQGDWAAISMIQDGQQLPVDDAQAYFRTIVGNKYTVFRYEKALAKWTFTIDATKKPKTIDSRREGDDKGVPSLGIYDLDAGMLKLCIAGAGKDRPTAFDSKPGSGHTYSVWEREKKK